jgi:hypothetical protein
MNTDEKRIRIAIACGWSEFDPDNIPNCIQYTAKAPDGKWGMTPDYFNDRNSMYEAIATLTDSQGVIFCCELNLMGIFGEWDILKATPSQLAEAFGKTLNLW